MSLIAKISAKLPASRGQRALLIGVTVMVLTIGIGWAWHTVSRELYFRQLTRELMAEEESEEESEANPSAADTYVNSFKYVAEITVGPAGFSPSALSVKPHTKLVFTGESDQPHRVGLAPGSPSPQYFEPKIDITNHAVFQTKVETPGTYSFYDQTNPQAIITVTVPQP